MKSPRAKGSNKYAIITLLQRHGPLSRIDLARRMKTSPSTITIAVNALIGEGVVRETTLKLMHGSGRPPVALTLVSGAGAAIGIEFGVRYVRGAIVDFSYDILASEEIGLGMDYTVPAGMAAALDIIARLKSKSGYSEKDLLGVGLGLPSPTDFEGKPTPSTLITNWKGANIRQMLADEVRLPLIIENDTRLSARAEHVWGAARGVDDFIYLKLHFGIGGAIVANGAIITGKSGGAGEIGHVCIDPAGPVCGCGNRGCLETYASIPAILNRIRPTYPDIDLDRLCKLYAEGDQTIGEVVTEAARRVAQLGAILCNTVNPELILIGGGLADLGEGFVATMKAEMQPKILELNRSPRVEIGALGSRATALGAVARVFELHTNNQLMASSGS